MTLSLLWRLLRERGSQITILVIPNDQNKESDQYWISPRLLRWMIALAVVVVVVGTTVLVTSPIADKLRGRDMEAMREQAITNSLRVHQLEDSLRTQREYATVVAALVGLETTSDSRQNGSDETPADTRDESVPLHPSVPPPINWEDHEQPAMPVERMTVVVAEASIADQTTRNYLSGLQLPFRPPVNGFVTRGFDARGGHFAVDIAVDAGTIVRAVGDG